MVMRINVLLVEDDRALREALSDTLLLAGHGFKAVGSAEEALQAVSREAFSLVVSDVNMPGMDGHELLGLLRAQQPQLPVLLMTAHGAVERAVDAMRQGAADYLVKPFEPKALLDLVARHALGSLGAAEAQGPVAIEPASVQLLELAARVARSDSTVLISGESGTGKEVLARYIHQHSRRVDQPALLQDQCALNSVVQFTHIPRPAIVGQARLRVRRKTHGGVLHFADVLGQQPLSQRQNVGSALAQRAPSQWKH